MGSNFEINRTFLGIIIIIKYIQGSPMKILSKQVSQYEYKAIKESKKHKRLIVQSQQAFPAQENENQQRKNKLFRAWNMDKKLQIIQKNEQSNVLSAFRAPLLGKSYKNQKKSLLWMGNHPTSILEALLYLILSNFTESGVKLFTQEKITILKGVLYNISQQYLLQTQKQILVQGICLLQYHTESLNQFIARHPSFENVCTKLVTSITFYHDGMNSQLEYAEEFLLNINSYLQQSIYKMMPDIDRIVEHRLLYKDEDDDEKNDFVLKIVLMGQRLCHIICQNGCIFIHEKEYSQEINKIQKIESQKSLFLRKTIDYHHKALTPFNIDFDDKVCHTPNDHITQQNIWQSSIFDSKFEKQTQNSSNNDQFLSKKITYNQSAHKQIQINIKTLDGLLRSKSQEMIQSINISEVQQKHPKINFQTFTRPISKIKILKFPNQFRQNNNTSIKNQKSPRRNNMPQFLIKKMNERQKSANKNNINGSRCKNTEQSHSKNKSIRRAAIYYSPGIKKNKNFILQ